MKNINYDLIKLLHMSLDKIWRLEKHYIKDAIKIKCHSVVSLKKMLKEEKVHAALLTKEIEMRIENNIFD